MIIITAPSGAGKTTVVRHLLASFDELAFSVSATTRKRRPHESNGVDYYFLSQEEFQERIERNEFIEWQEVYTGQYYGTLKSEIDRLSQLGKYIIFDIEVIGALNIKKAYPDSSLSIFVMPPSPDVLFERLRNRNTESEDSLRKRTERAALELTYANKFDHVLVNDELSYTLAQAEELVSNFLDL